MTERTALVITRVRVTGALPARRRSTRQEEGFNNQDYGKKSSREEEGRRRNRKKMQMVTESGRSSVHLGSPSEADRSLFPSRLESSTDRTQEGERKKRREVFFYW